MSEKWGWNEQFKSYNRRPWIPLNTMLGSVDFVGPRRLLRVFKECTVFGLKTSWKDFPKEGDLPGRGPVSHWLSQECHHVRELCDQRAPQGIQRTYKCLHEKASIWTPEVHPWTSVKSSDQYPYSLRLQMNHLFSSLWKLINIWIDFRSIFYYNKQHLHDNCFIYILCILAHFFSLGRNL